MRPPVERQAASVSDVDEVWAGHPVEFALLTVENRQFVAYYDDERYLTVAQRPLGDDEWVRARLPERVGWDSHNAIRVAADDAGHLHLSGNVHDDPLVYFRSADPLDATTLERVESLVGRDEDAVTYPRFVDGPDGDLVFMYRDGASGDGRRLLNAYDPDSGEWRRLLPTALLDGRGEMNAYPTGPVRGPDGDYHLAWVWRDTPDAATNHDLSYARSPDLVHWERSDGTPLDLPITAETGEVIDPVPAGGGMLNGVSLGFDADGRPVVSYHKFDDAGHTQAYNARPGAGGWSIARASDWGYRWEFGGYGTIEREIEVDPVTATGEGLVQTFRHTEHGPGRWILDPERFDPVRTDVPWHGLPDDCREPACEDLTVQWQPGSGAGRADAAAGSTDYALRWAALPANRDRPREERPDPVTLRVYEFE